MLIGPPAALPVCCPADADNFGSQLEHLFPDALDQSGPESSTQLSEHELCRRCDSRLPPGLDVLSVRTAGAVVCFANSASALPMRGMREALRERLLQEWVMNKRWVGFLPASPLREGLPDRGLSKPV